MADDRRRSGLNDPRVRVLDDLVLGRRSIRRYQPDPLPEAWVEAILRCARQAPSPSNSQPVRFVRIRSVRHIESLKRSLGHGHARLIAKHAALKGSARMRNRINAYHRYAQVMFGAPELLAVGVATEIDGFSPRLHAVGLMEDLTQHRSDVDMTVGLALQGLLLKAHALGAGSCILTAPLVFIKDVAAVLELQNIVVKCFVALGMAAETPVAPERLPLQAVVKVI
jgi:nitroreductase